MTHTEPLALTESELKTITGGLRAEWMDAPATDPEQDLKALWMDEE